MIYCIAGPPPNPLLRKEGAKTSPTLLELALGIAPRAFATYVGSTFQLVETNLERHTAFWLRAVQAE